MERKSTELKEKVKSIAKLKNIALKDIYGHLGISQVAFDKCFYSKNIEYSKRIHDIADFLGVPIEELVSSQKEEINISENLVNETIESYYSNNKQLDEKTLLHVMKSENMLLKQIIERQEKEIEFLRGQLTK